MCMRVYIIWYSQQTSKDDTDVSDMYVQIMLCFFLYVFVLTVSLTSYFYDMTWTRCRRSGLMVVDQCGS